MGKEGEHEVQQRKLHLVMAFTKKSKKKANDDDEDDEGFGEGFGGRRSYEGGAETTNHAADPPRVRARRRDDTPKTAPVLDVMSDDDLKLLCNRGFTLHEFAPGATVTTWGTSARKLASCTSSWADPSRRPGYGKT